MTDSELRSLLAERLAAVNARIVVACQRSGRDRAAVTLVAVTKSVSPRVATLLPGLGVRDLGESRPQEQWKKAAAISGVNWHFIGHLQRNKLERTMPLVSLIHSVDSVRLLTALDAFGREQNSMVRALLEVNCSREPAKGGFAPEELASILQSVSSESGVQIEGLMTMASHYDNPERCRPTFSELRSLRDDMRTRTGLSLPQLSMGMSNDFEIAIEEGATLVRIGTTLFEGLERE